MQEFTQERIKELQERNLITESTPKKEIIGVWVLTNTITVNLLQINYNVEDTAIIEYQGKQSEHLIKYSNSGDYCYIQVGALKLNFDDCLRYD